jgi:hypothetical protein
MAKLLAFLPVLAIALIAGCIGQAPGPSGQVRVAADDGLVITDFNAEPTGLRVGDSAIFTLFIENQGGVVADNVLAFLAGIEGQWREPGTDNLAGLTNKELGKLDAPNPDFGEPGDFKVVTWTFKTPALPPGLATTLPVTANVVYDYNTTGSIVIRAIGERFLRTEYLPKGRTPPGPVVANTNAPVKITIPGERGSYYIVVDDDPEADDLQEFPVIVRLENVGSGFPVTGGQPGAIFGTISVRGPGSPVFRDCLGQSGTPDVEITPNSLGGDIARLRTTSGAAIISCTVELQKQAFLLQDESIRLDFNLGYRYFIQSQLEVGVSSR